MASQRQDWAVRHHVERIDASYRLSDGVFESVTLRGVSDGKRSSLWSLVVTSDGYDTLEDFEHDGAPLLCSLIDCLPMDQH